MIIDWNSFENWREKSIIYHKESSEYSYLNALTYFEHAREYFNKNGFPEQTEKYKSGELRPWSINQKQKQKDDINEFIKNKSFKKVQKRRSRRKSL